MTLHAAKFAPGSSPYCGPFALSVLTGRPAEDFQPRRPDGRPERRGMFVVELLAHLATAGWTVNKVYFRREWPGRRRYPRLWRVLRPGRRGVALVGPTEHYVVVDGFMVYDTLAGRRTWVHDHPCRYWDVSAIYEVTR